MCLTPLGDRTCERFVIDIELCIGPLGDLVAICCLILLSVPHTELLVSWTYPLSHQSASDRYREVNRFTVR